MNTQTHTPGPWQIAPGDSRAVFTGQHAKPIKCPNQADARLIAAAPELLTALRGMVHLYTHQDASSDGAAIVANARAALAKVQS